MVLQCDHCGKKFFLKLGEQEWLERHSRKGLRPNRCVECEEYPLSHPVSHSLDTRAGTLRIHTAERCIMQSFRVPVPAKRLHVPVAKLGSANGPILWQRFQLGRTTINRLQGNVLKGATELALEPSENLPDGPLSAGSTITIAHMTRNLVHFDRSSHCGTIDLPFPSKLLSGSEYVIFRSSDVDGNGLPAPLCLDDHNVDKKRRREMETWKKLVLAEKRISTETRKQQSTMVLDKWGPPCRANRDDLDTARFQRFRFNCQIFTSAIERFAYRGSDLITYPEKEVRTMTLATFMGLHEGLGEHSPLYLLHNDPEILSNILNHVFPPPWFPQWRLIKTVSSTISSHISRPCALVVADVDDSTFAEQKARERQEEQRRLRQIGMQARPSTAVSKRGKSLASKASTASATESPLDNRTRYDLLKSLPSTGKTSSQNMSPALFGFGTASGLASTNDRYFGDVPSGSLDSTMDTSLATENLKPHAQEGNLKSQILGVMNARFQQMTVGAALKREVQNRPERLFVCDDEQSCVKVFLVDGQLERTIGKDVIRVPGGVAVTSDGRVLVTDVWLHQVHVFNLIGTLLLSFGGFGKEPGFFSCPRGIAVGPKGQIFVCDSHNHRVQVFSRAGKPMRCLGSQGARPGFLDEPLCVAVDHAGRVAVSEAGSARVQIFDHGGTLLHVVKNLHWGDDAPAAAFLEADQSGAVEELGMPVGLCFTKDGRLWVTDVYYHRILLFDSDMHPLQKFGAGGGWGGVKPWSEPFRMLRSVGMGHLGRESHAPVGGEKGEELHGPTSVGVSSSGRVIVADSDNFRVQVFI